MNKLHIGAMAALAAAGTAVAHADPTPPTPDYTWECDTDEYGHTSCRAVPKPECGITPNDRRVYTLPPGTLEQPGIPTIGGQELLPFPCNIPPATLLPGASGPYPYPIVPGPTG
jgi:hypothetical protein